MDLVMYEQRLRAVGNFPLLVQCFEFSSEFYTTGWMRGRMPGLLKTSATYLERFCHETGVRTANLGSPRK